MMAESVDDPNREAGARSSLAPPASAASSSLIPPSAAAAKQGRLLLPFYGANLAAIYGPGLLPIALEVYRNSIDEGEPLSTRTLAVDLLASPWAGLMTAIEGSVLMFADSLGKIGSLYAFLLTLWIGVLLLSIAYCNYAHRYRLTFVLFVLSAVQAIFVAERLLAEQEPPPAPPPPRAEVQPKMEREP